MVFTIHGTITAKDLPPIVIKDRTGIVVPRFKYFKQSVRLNGLDTAEFKEAIAAGKAICDVFDMAFAEGQLQEWGSTDGNDNNIDITNRYMTPIEEVILGEEHVPFDTDIDPKGMLEDKWVYDL
ncbi:hypothetical protein C0992_010360 [Termitomyces sp. T32_za158]|nr:hypothetical protein C0992_010360 [Termitomyces sp. T32_za158]